MAELAPSDAELDAFWRSTLARLAAQPMNAKVEPLKEKLPYFVYRVTLTSLDGVPIRAYMSTPVDCIANGRTPRTLPAIVTGPGYGGWEFGQTLSECQRGYVVLQVFPRGQGESSELWKVRDGAEQAWVNHGKEKPEGFFYQGGYCDMLRGVDFLLTRPEVDPLRVGMAGTSQGGLLVLAAAALDPRVKACVAHVPALCDLTHHPPKGLVPALADDPAFARTWNWFDPWRLASRIHAATLLSSGGRDAVCPPASIHAIYNQLPGIRSITHYPDLIHTSSNDFYDMTWQWLARYLR